MAGRDHDVLTIDVTPEERRQIDEVARQRGYANTEELLHDLLRRLIEYNADLNHALLRVLAPEGDADDQAYFWTEEWQAAERKVDEEIAAGQYKDFDTMEDFLADLMSDDE